MFQRRDKVEFIDVKSYPQMVRACDAAILVSLLKGADAQRRAGRAILARTSQMRDAVLDYVTGLEQAARAGDDAATFEQSHEIRGLAGTVELLFGAHEIDHRCRFELIEQHGPARRQGG